jgi:hypothetical protein
VRVLVFSFGKSGEETHTLINGRAIESHDVAVGVRHRGQGGVDCGGGVLAGEKGFYGLDVSDG